jgi:hypothetical protein
MNNLKQIQEFVKEKCGGLDISDIMTQLTEQEEREVFLKIMELRTKPFPIVISVEGEIKLLTGFAHLENSVQLAIAKLLGGK